MREMIETGNDCLTRIPAEWQHPRLKYYCKISNGSDPQTEGNIPAYGSGREVVKFCGEYKEGPAILLGRKGTLDNPKYIDGKFWNVDTAMDAYPTNGINPRYLFFIMTILDIQRYATSTAKPSMTQGDYYNMPIPVPSREEQDMIVAFIDTKCAVIDEAIERHEKAVDKLNEYKRASIVNIVFSGLREEAKKENKEWFGALPYGWNYARIKYLLSERNERSEDGKEEPLTMSQKVGIIPTKEFGETPHGAATFVGAKKVYLDDLVFNKLKAHLGVFSVSKYNGLVSPDYAVYYTNGKANPKYLEYVFKTPQCIAEFIKRITGVGQGLMRLYTDELFDITCPCPSIEEQNEIALYLDDLCKKISNAQQKQYDIITKLEEYRKSLIYHAVTGKIDCRGNNAS